MYLSLLGQLVEFLKRVESKGPLSCDTILKIFYQTCRAVQHMHRQKPPVIHRDLKVPAAIKSACWVPSCLCPCGVQRGFVEAPSGLLGVLTQATGLWACTPCSPCCLPPCTSRCPCCLALGGQCLWEQACRVVQLRVTLWLSGSVLQSPSCQLCRCLSLSCGGFIGTPLCSQRVCATGVFWWWPSFRSLILS